MRLRVLLSGLTFFVAALVLGWAPLLAPASTRPCTITGTAGPDYLLGTQRADVICGLGGNDTIAGLGGNDTIRAGAGNDRMTGDGGSDHLLGGPGRDLFYAYDGTRDLLQGGTGYDRARLDRTLDARSSVEALQTYP